MKIAIASSNRSHLMDVARELSLLGHSVVFYTFTPKWRLKRYNVDIKDTFSVFWYCVIGLCVNRLFPSEFSRELLRRQLDGAVAVFLKGCDVLICQSPYFGKTMKRGRNKFGAKIILDRGSNHVRHYNEVLKSIGTPTMPERYMVFDESQYQYADYVVIASTYVKECFVARGVASKKLFVNPYGFDMVNFHPTALSTSDVFDVLFVGTFSRQKGADLLLEVCRRCKLRLLHVGAFNDVEFPQNDNQFFHHDAVPENRLIDYYRQAKVFCLPSHDEGFGLVLVQAIICGLPVVTTRFTGGPDLQTYVSDSSYIQIMSQCNVEMLSKALRLAMDKASVQTDVRDYIGCGLDNLSWHGYALRYDAFLKSLKG